MVDCVILERQTRMSSVVPSEVISYKTTPEQTFDAVPYVRLFVAGVSAEAWFQFQSSQCRICGAGIGLCP
jgi:hypothetical protein